MLQPDSFDHPGRLALLIVVAALLGAYVVLAARRRSVQRSWADDALAGSVATRRPTWLRHVPALLLTLALVGMTTAFAGPREDRVVERERATIVVALDTSTSMLATDVAPDRFTAAKAGATRFVENLPDSFDVALVSFNQTATLRVPPTQDHAAVTRSINRLQLSGGTALGDAISTSLAALATPEAMASGAVVLLADGGSTTGSPLEPAVQQAIDAQVPVNTIAYGTADGIVVSGGRTFQVPVDEPALAAIADATGGTAFTAATADQLDSVYADLRTRLSKVTEAQDVSAPLAGIALALLAAGAAPALLRR